MPQQRWANRGSPDCKHLSSLPVISRPFKRNFNNKQFSPTSEANLQVCRNFTKWEHSGSTENPGPAGSGLRSREWVCREESVQQMQREKDKKSQDTEFLVLLPPETRLLPGYPGMFLITPHFSPLPLVGLSVSYLQHQTPSKNTKCSDINEKNSCPPSLRDQGRPFQGTDDGPFADSQDTRLRGKK